MLLELFWSFLQVGLFSFGGGMVAITLLMEKLVYEKAWLDAAAFTDLISIAESTPGPIAVNAATFVGIQLAGLPGALIATLATVLPGCLIVLALSLLYQRYRSLTLVQGMMDGLRPTIIAAIFVSGFSLLRSALFDSGILSLANIDWLSVVCFVAVIILTQKTKLSAAVLILGSGAIGCVLRLLIG